MTAPPPFVVFALPRSRTAWLSAWLSSVAAAPVGHDLAIEADTIDDWLEGIWRRHRGTCETGSVEAWPILRRAIPDCRIITIHRPLDAVCAALNAAGYVPPIEQLQRRYEALVRLSGEPGVVAFQFDALGDPRVCATLQEHALAQPFDWQAWRAADGCNVQVSPAQRLGRLWDRREAIERLKGEMAARLAKPRPFVSVGEEAWAGVAEAVERMGVAHHAEATEALAGAYRLDQATLLRLAEAGLWRVFVARVDSVFAGYCCWMRETNLEETAPPTMTHGPFYAAPEYARHRLGLRLLRASREALAAEGFKVLRLHHTTHGRGARAGRLYEAMGAVEYQREYFWRIGADA